MTKRAKNGFGLNRDDAASVFHFVATVLFFIGAFIMVATFCHELAEAPLPKKTAVEGSPSEDLIGALLFYHFVF